MAPKHTHTEHGTGTTSPILLLLNRNIQVNACACVCFNAIIFDENILSDSDAVHSTYSNIGDV